MQGPNTKTTSYDEVPYPSKPFRQTHPDRLATIAHLFGLTPPPIDKCRVLELGCASGDNIIPMAEQLPQSHFVGIDLSGRQIEMGRSLLERTGLQNVELRQMDLLDVDGSLGTFDYIIAHGIYSWVPTNAQDKILSICSSNLASNGIAYVSYNVYPGWHMRGMIRDMMLYHASRFREPAIRVKQARALLDFLAKNSSKDSAHGRMLADEVEVLRRHDDGYLFHDHLEQNNAPVYFYQFVQHARSRGLQYVGEAEMSAMWSGHLPPDVAATLQRVAADDIQIEQYMDFLRNRMFRQTLLCQQGLRIDRMLKPESLQRLYISSPLAPVDGGGDLRPAGPMKFQHRSSDVNLTTSIPLVKAAVSYLAEVWPASIAYLELLSQASKRLKLAPFSGPEQVKADSEALGKSLLEFYLSGIAELRCRPDVFTVKPGSKPLASVVARAQAEMGYRLITNLRHESGMPDDLTRQVLRLLDGTNSREDLLSKLQKMLKDGTLVTSGGPDATKVPAELRRQLAEALDGSLSYLASNAFCLR